MCSLSPLCVTCSLPALCHVLSPHKHVLYNPPSRIHVSLTAQSPLVTQLTLIPPFTKPGRTVYTEGPGTGLVLPRNRSHRETTLGINSSASRHPRDICIVMYISVPPGFCDSAITEFIAKSCKLRNFCKNSHIFIITADFRRFWA